MTCHTYSAVDSLKNLTIHYISYNILNLSSKQQQQIVYIPNNAKNKILRKILCVSSVPVKLGPLLFNQIFRDLINEYTFALDLSNVGKMDVQMLKSLRKCKKAVQLTFDGLIDDCLVDDLKETFKQLDHLRNLTITNSPIVRSDIIRVISEFATELEALDLRGCLNFDDTCVNVMRDRLVKLRHVGLSRTAISSEGVCALVRGRGGLRELVIGGCAKLRRMALEDNGVMMRAIATNCPQLLYLHADHMPMSFLSPNENDDGLSIKKCARCKNKDRGDSNYKCNCMGLQQLTFTVPL